MSAVHEALVAVMRDVDHVAKKDRNNHQNFNFRGIDAVVNAVGPALRAHQVLVVPQVESVAYDQVQTSTGKPATACRVKVTYIFAATDGSTIEASVIGEAWDSGDKAAPKAMSVAFRTALLQALALPTDEPDPDSHTFERSSVDTSRLNALIAQAEALGIEGDWDKARTYAAQSQAHADKAAEKLAAQIAAHDPSVGEGDGEAPAPAEAQPSPADTAPPEVSGLSGEGGQGKPSQVSGSSPEPSPDQPYEWRQHARDRGVATAELIVALGKDWPANDLARKPSSTKSITALCEDETMVPVVRAAIDELAGVTADG